MPDSQVLILSKTTYQERNMNNNSVTITPTARLHLPLKPELSVLSYLLCYYNMSCVAFLRTALVL